MKFEVIWCKNHVMSIYCKDTGEYCLTYDDYLCSEHWKRFRIKFYTVTKQRKCAVCQKGKNLQLHHLTYKRLGREKISDVIALCGKCHKLEHAGVSHLKEIREFKAKQSKIQKKASTKKRPKPKNKRSNKKRGSKRRASSRMEVLYTQGID